MSLEPENYLVIGMFVSFIALLFTGFPVAWVLGGVGIFFTGVGYLTDILGWTLTGLDYDTLGLRSDEYSVLWTIGYWSLYRCLSSWG